MPDGSNPIAHRDTVEIAVDDLRRQPRAATVDDRRAERSVAGLLLGEFGGAPPRWITSGPLKRDVHGSLTTDEFSTDM